MQSIIETQRIPDRRARAAGQAAGARAVVQIDDTAEVESDVRTIDDEAGRIRRKIINRASAADGASVIADAIESQPASNRIPANVPDVRRSGAGDQQSRRGNRTPPNA